MRAHERLRALLLGLFAVSSAQAHDFWIEPSRFALEGPGRSVAIDLSVGDDFRGERFPRDPAHLRSFAVLGPDAHREIPGRAGSRPAGLWTPTAQGTHVISYRSRRTAIELPAESFERYLAEKGLDDVLLARALGERDHEPGREVFSRCAKALVVVGAADDGGHARRAGLPLEIVPERAPWDVAADEELSLLVLWKGRAREGLLVQARRHDVPEQAVEAVTDADGRVSLHLPGPGRWLIAAVHAEAAPPDLPAPLSADWESTWATLTFELGSESPQDVAAATRLTTEIP